MASSISLEYLQSIEGAANGLATLDSSGTIPVVQLPAIAITSPYKGSYADYLTLATAFPTGSVADYAYVEDEAVFYYWNQELGSPSWIPQTITENDYSLLSAAAKSQVPYIIIPNI